MSSDTKRIALWGGWYGSHNVGDEALLLSITDLLGERFPDVEFFVFTDNRTHVNEYTGRESNHRITAFQNKPQFHRLVHSLAACDLFVLGGGCPFYDQPYHLMVMGALISLARTFGTPYMTWSVSSQEVDREAAKRLFKWMLDGAAAVTFRDRFTRALFEECGVRRPMEMAPDSVFTLGVERGEEVDRLIRRAGVRDHGRPLAALTPRVLRGRDGEAESHYNPKTPDQYEKKLLCFAAALDWLWGAGYQPIFAPMNTIAPDDDRMAARAVIDRARHGSRALLIDEDIRPRFAPAIFERCQIAMAARVHAGVSAMIGQCPVIMYAFDPKHAGIMESMGLDRHILDAKTADPAGAVGMLAKLHDAKGEVKRSMARQLRTLREKAMRPAYIAERIIAKKRARKRV